MFSLCNWWLFTFEIGIEQNKRRQQPMMMMMTVTMNKSICECRLQGIFIFVNIFAIISESMAIHQQSKPLKSRQKSNQQRFKG